MDARQRDSDSGGWRPSRNSRPRCWRHGAHRRLQRQRRARSRVILTGVIGDFGEAVSVYPDGTIDPQHNAELNVALTRARSG